MKADVELNLVHDGEQWIARGGAVVAVGETLHEVDESVTHALRDSGDFPLGSSVTVFMGFDFDTIPTWLRQYHAHYFNRYITVNL